MHPHTAQFMLPRTFLAKHGAALWYRHRRPQTAYYLICMPPATRSLSKGGSFASGAEEELPGEHACNEALNHCYELLASCLRRAEDVSPEMKA
jgi:hypothetical protein